ncbi:hypothetical protein GCM10008995_09010 [Halobellus salinus]|uniref:Amino acid permease n=1 Tax=Halobellus salinus TaxID=931585 RepID=A0A830EQW7_9EURY|nr:hypothetical protein GCM10008995_09010 [Halobellus salinus]SMP18552.1 Amino acid permease [Halobellus salinus]
MTAAEGEPSDAGENRAGEAPTTVAPPTATEETTTTDAGSELERTIGLSGGITIGVGTMIGAGIFVFPGLAAGRAGPAAAGSFALGAVIALLVALPASELATAMPKSGGGYYFISRGLGALPGAIVGISIWLGLVFATAFYLTLLILWDLCYRIGTSWWAAVVALWRSWRYPFDAETVRHLRRLYLLILSAIVA